MWEYEDCLKAIDICMREENKSEDNFPAYVYCYMSLATAGILAHLVYVVVFQEG